MKRHSTTDWRQRACRDEDPELFFPVGTSGPALVQTEAAKTVCRRCPIRPQCLSWALTSGQDAGVWGGLDENERRRLRRQPCSDQPPSSHPRADWVAVDRLVHTGRAAVGTYEEVALAALWLIRAGWTPSRTAEHLGVSLPTVREWVARADTAAPLVRDGEGRTGRRRRVAS
jgi:WhiB family redox-sensing transcriptional regulator